MIFSTLIFLTAAFGLFLLGVWAIFVLRHNLIVVLIAIEMMLLAANLLLVYFSVYLDDIVGQVFALYVLTVAAAESAIGLAILVAYYRLSSTIAMESISMLKG